MGLLNFQPRDASRRDVWWATKGTLSTGCEYIHIRTQVFGCATSIMVYGPGRHSESATPRQYYTEQYDDIAVFMGSNGTMEVWPEDIKQLTQAIKEATQLLRQSKLREGK